MKKFLLSTSFLMFLVACSHEEYTEPSPIEMKPRSTVRPTFQDTAIDRYGDESTEPEDNFEKEENIIRKADVRREIQDDIAMAERKRRAKKLTRTEVKNITIKRKSTDMVASAPEPVKETPIMTKKTEMELKLEDDDLDADD